MFQRQLLRLLMNQQNNKASFLKAGFSTFKLDRYNFSKYLTINLEISRDNVELRFPDLSTENYFKVISHPLEGTLKELLEKIKEVTQNDTPLKAYTYEKSEISDITQLESLKGRSFYILGLNGQIYNIKNQEEPITNSYTNLENEINQTSLSFIQKSVYFNYLKRLDNCLSISHGVKVFDDGQKYTKNIDKEQLVKDLIAALPQKRNKRTENEQKLLRDYTQLTLTINQLKEQKAKLELLAAKSEKRKMLLGLFALIGQFSFVAVGTYSIWSWDIVEPMAYFLTLTGSIYISSHFFKFYDDYSNENYFQWRKTKALERICKKNNFDLEQFKALEHSQKNLETLIKSHILSNL